MKQQKERPVWKLFFDLLKVTTGNRDQLPVVPTAEAWHTIYQLASQQALVGVLYGGINRLPKEQLPPQDLLLKWYAMARQIEQCNEQLNAECVEVARYLTQQGYDYAILKGQSLASLYPQPQLRTPGDIDVWLHPRDLQHKSLAEVRRRVIDFAVSHGAKRSITYCHIHFPYFQETEVKLHFTPSWMNGPLDNRRLQAYFGEESQTQFSHTISLTKEGAQEVMSPTIEFNRFYILLHIYRHLFGEGIGMRQLMDYYFVLIQPATEESRQRTLKLIDQMHMTRFTAAMMFLMKYLFGMPDRYLLLPPDAYEGKSLLIEILQSGNFGKYDSRIPRKQLSKSAVHRFFYSFKHNAAFLRHYPYEVLRDPFFRLWLYFWRIKNGWL